MSAIPDASSSPTLAERWIKANIAAAILSGMASFAVYGVKHAVGAAEPDAEFGALVVLYIATIAFSGFAGAASGVLTGAVLQRIIRRLPAWTWIALHAGMSIAVGVAVELMDMSRTDRASEAATADPLVLPSSVVFGAIVFGAISGAVVGGLEALVLRQAATGMDAWIKWSAAAFAAAWLLLVTGATLLPPSGGLISELVNQALSFAAAVIVALLMLPALRLLQPRATS
jgi:hypothetical protein